MFLLACALAFADDLTLQISPASPSSCGPYVIRVSERDSTVASTRGADEQSVDIRIRLPTSDDAGDDVIGDISCRCDQVCSLPGATVAIVDCPP